MTALHTVRRAARYSDAVSSKCRPAGSACGTCGDSCTPGTPRVPCSRSRLPGQRQTTPGHSAASDAPTFRNPLSPSSARCAASYGSTARHLPLHGAGRTCCSHWMMPYSAQPPLTAQPSRPRVAKASGSSSKHLRRRLKAMLTKAITTARRESKQHRGRALERDQSYRIALPSNKGEGALSVAGQELQGQTGASFY